jgi:hypothetical protein
MAKSPAAALCSTTLGALGQRWQAFGSDLDIAVLVLEFQQTFAYDTGR